MPYPPSSITDPQSLDIPEVIETERLLIRCPQPGDGQEVNQALRESWENLSQWMAWASGPPPSVAESETLQRSNRSAYLARSGFHFNMYRKDTGEFVGKPALFNIAWNVPKCEIGYWVRTCFEGQGYITESVLALTAFAFDTLGMARVELRCDPRNTRSAAVAARAGFMQEGCLRQEARDPQGCLRDTLVFASHPLPPSLASERGGTRESH